MKIGENTKKNFPDSNELTAMKMIPAIPNPMRTQLHKRRQYPVMMLTILMMGMHLELLVSTTSSAIPLILNINLLLQ